MNYSLGRPWWLMGWGRSSASSEAALQAPDLPMRKLRRLLHFHATSLEGGPPLSLISHQLNEHKVQVFLDSFLCAQEVLTLQVLLFPGCRLCCQAVVESSRHQGSGCEALLSLVMSADQRKQWVRYLDHLG